MALQVQMESINWVSCSVASLCPSSQSLHVTKPLKFFSAPKKLNIRLSGAEFGTCWIDKRMIPCYQITLALARAGSDGMDEVEAKKEVDVGFNLWDKKDPHLEGQHKASQLKKRLVSGLVIGISGGGAILMGGWLFTVAVACAAFIAAQEYFEMVKGFGIAAGITLPQYVSRVCSVICAFMPIWTLYFGHVDISLTYAAFIVIISLLLQRGDSCFHQLTSAFFGLFYCGYLPCFWVKLRCSLSVPALNTKIGYNWPVLLGGQTHWTVGLVATLITVCSIVAADTYAFLGGKTFGRTPLTNISPKKTWEGALLGLSGCVATSIILSKILCWPTSLWSFCSLLCNNQ